MTCPCSICKRHARIDAVKESRDVDALITLVDELHDALAHTEDDRDHKDCILNGSWPNAVARLEAALVDARAKAEAGK